VKWLASTYGIFPIGEPIGPVLRIAPNHGDKSVANESHHEEDLEHGQVKFSSSEVPDSETVEPTAMLK
jgi:hypothetical protein